ncbi:hypothetical protein MNBD_GAMMA12-2073 [hydrothermal vent metagenome]|uniref:PEP-CTERM protein-sorting domain-containing protein n=1 Tax=hydrothermal vent metagenome TaxID=652676 RepID=A0A3B0YLQ5_9ZZZZ
MIKIRAFLIISLALLYSVGASAAPVSINKMSIDEATVSINFGGGAILGNTMPFTPPIDITMGVFQSDIISIGSTANDGFLLKIYSTGTYGAPAPSATVDNMNNTIDVDFSSLRGTITRGTGITKFDTDFSLSALFGNLLKNDYDASTGMIDMLFAENINVDVFGASIPATLEIGIKGAVSAVPVPAAVWLFGSGMIALFGFSRKNTLK